MIVEVLVREQKIALLLVSLTAMTLLAIALVYLLLTLVELPMLALEAKIALQPAVQPVAPGHPGVFVDNLEKILDLIFDYKDF